MQLTLGPVLFNWAPDRWRDFYFHIADEAPVDIVVIGEIVCSKRRPFIAPMFEQVIERLSASGKTVILASLIMPTLERERRETERLASDSDMMTEANDVSCLAHLAGRTHAVGPFINVYNEATATFLAAFGASRICLPHELPLASIAAIVNAVPGTAIEVHGFGRVPLAISARCYHARLHDLSKDNCRFVCERDPDGLLVETLDGDGFLAINGVQTLSSTCASLIADITALEKAGVAAIRLSPQDCDMAGVARVFRRALDGCAPPNDSAAALTALYPNVPFSNGFLHGREGAALFTPTAPGLTGGMGCDAL